MQILRLAIIGLVLFGTGSLLHARNPAPRAKLGAYYFDGWTGKTFHITERLKTEFAHRKPIWGWQDDSPEVMKQQIDLAADHGIAFFSFCWYWPEGKIKEAPMNNALELFLAAPNARRMEFCLLVANHGGYRIGPKDWDAVSQKWVELFKKPTHLKVDGKPVIVFFSARELLTSFGSPAELKKAFEQLRQRCRDAGLPGATIACCATPGPEHGWTNLAQLEEAGVDLLTGYNYPGAGVKGKEKRRPFAELMEGSERIWEAFAKKTRLPYAPVVTAGWDKRPWEKLDLPAEKQSYYYDDRTPKAVGEFIERAIRWMDKNPGQTTKDRLLLVYAWNENGEGGYLTPTEKDGKAYVEAVKAAVYGK